MNSYRIFKNPSGHTEAVKQGWSWPAFFFAIIWALIKQLWYVAAIIFLIILPFVIYYMPDLMNATEQQIAEASYKMNIIGTVVGVPIRIILVLFGNKLREKNLIKRNYQLVGIISARSPATAIERYLEGKNSFLDI